ncbi:SLFNL1 [Branchiostoma lanceolatum]|uniref:SLFNL1 protein n=1 Tax=Branchiostoma lanceolatum TaxID=7740 RepID=A0A8J9ZS85_BRALA|nr:SLFNL1 [Branchiostoma lanceolatum]
MSESHGVFVGNLNPSRGKEDLRHGLTCLLTSLGFSAVTEDDVEVKKKHRRAFGFIYFQCAEEQKQAFSNLSDGGTLMVGVTDDGQVCGVSCDHRREDNVRIDIDSVIKGFRPQVFPSQYSVKFTPVLELYGDAPTNRKVLSITVHTPTDRHQGLYATPHGEVFVRRDGSVEELSASGVQEWCRRNYQKDLQVLQDRERQLLRELQDKEHREQQRLKEQQDKDVSSQNYLQDLHVLQDREQQLLQELQDKEHRLKEVEKKLSSKSKVCVVL